MTQIKKIEGFTPGPWSEAMSGDHLGVVKAEYIESGNLEHPVCLISPTELINDEDVANASLIAYAPELYAIALEQEREIERLKGLLKKELHDKVIGEGFHEIAFTVRWLEYSRFNNL